MSDKKDLSLPEALDFLKKGLKELAAEHEKALTELKKAEAEQLAKKKLKKEMGQGMIGIGSSGSIGGGLSLSEKKAEKTKKNEYIDGYHANEPDKRIITLGPGKKPVLPGQKPVREDGNDEGSGGQTSKLKKEALDKAGFMGTKPPGGTAGPGTAPTPGPSVGLPPKPKVKPMHKCGEQMQAAYPVKKGELNPDKLAQRLQNLGQKGAKTDKAKADAAHRRVISQHVSGGKIKPPKDEPLVEHPKKTKAEVPKKRLPHVTYAGVKKASLGMDAGGAPKGPRIPKAPGVSNPGGTPAGAVAQKADLPNLAGFQSLVPNKPKPAKDKAPKLPGVKMPGMGMAKNELAKVAPPGREEQVKELKGKVDNPFAVAWASYNKSHKAKKALPDMSGYQSLVDKKPKASPDPVAQTNKELKGFQSLAPKPKGKQVTKQSFKTRENK